MDLNLIKSFIGIIAVILTFVGYVPYIKDTIKGITKPHVYSWFLWGFVTLIAFALQVSGNGGMGSLVTLVAALVSFLIFGLGMRNGNKDISKTDTYFLITAFIAVVIWVFAKQPIISVVLISLIDMLGFAPTIRKSWNNPFSETLLTYSMNTFRHSLGIIALQQYSVVTCLYPITWVLANGLFSAMLIIRRKQITS
jgi:hypothetical protein